MSARVIITILWNQDPCYPRTSQRQTCADRHDNPEAEYKRFLNGLTDGSLHTGTKAGRKLQAGEFDFVRLQLRQNAGRQGQVSQAWV